MTSRPYSRFSAGPPRLAAIVLALSATVMLGRAEAGPLRAIIDHITGRAAASPPGAVAEARCYGRYVVWRDAIAAAIRITNAWPSVQLANDFYRMQAAFTAVLSAERGVTPRLSPDVNEADLPADVRLAFEQGVQDAKARLGGAEARGLTLAASSGGSGAAAMARDQAVIDGAFAPLKAQCERQVDVHPISRPQPPRTMASNAPPPAPAAPPPNAAQPDDAVAGVLAVWDSPKWIQVGVFDHPEAVAPQRRAVHVALSTHGPTVRRSGASIRVLARAVTLARAPRAILVSNPAAKATNLGLRGPVL